MTQLRMTNNAGINLAVAVWLAHDDYDYVDKPNYISVTTLIKPIRQILLPLRIPPADQIVDISERVQSSFGQALHTGIETSWVHHYRTSLQKLGYPARAIESIEVNPEKPDPEKIQVYTEVRVERSFAGYIIGGKFDLCIEGRLQDVKKTSVWGYLMQKGISDDKWVLQGSLYRWLNPDKVTHDEMFIQYLLLDWSRGMLKRDPTKYPPHPLPHRTVRLMPVNETERWIQKKLMELEYYKDKPEKELPPCSDEDLWRGDPQYKYFANADAPPGTRSTKNFDELSAALMHKNEKGKGRVDVVPGKVKACNYCAASPICSQRAMLEAAGELDEF